jgi:hypothetical protein
MVASGGAEGIRTPDLLIANETRYQLRHSPGRRSDHGETAQPNGTLAPGQARPKRSGVRRPGPLSGLIAGRRSRLLVGARVGGFGRTASPSPLVYRR